MWPRVHTCVDARLYVEERLFTLKNIYTTNSVVFEDVSKVGLKFC